MDFIRDMVSCKENGFKEAEFSDSDSELDVTDQLPINTTTTQNNLKPLVTVTSSSATTSTTSDISYETVTKQEPDIDLELEQVAQAKTDIPAGFLEY
ncbi:hypothetical protein DOY81_011169 [Sarcophaga bullata]|nr:hypothetical protein DOY81_011169 [Sarcophaga bullata]